MKQRGSVWQNRSISWLSFDGKALDPLFSSGLGSFRQMLYFSDSRQSVGSAAKHPPAVTSCTDDGLVFCSRVVRRKLMLVRSFAPPSCCSSPPRLGSSPYFFFQGFSLKRSSDLTSVGHSAVSPDYRFLRRPLFALKEGAGEARSISDRNKLSS